MKSLWSVIYFEQQVSVIFETDTLTLQVYFTNNAEHNKSLK